MLLNKLTSKKNLVILGLNSGTSADSLDMAIVKFIYAKKSYKIKYITGKEIKYPKSLKENILRLSEASKIDLNELIYFDNVLGKFFGQKASTYIEKLQNQNIKIDTVASHGQTIRHLPEKVKKFHYVVNGTMQLGSPEFIAAATGKVVISDFRQADIAVGGEGAPITTPAVEMLFAVPDKSRLIVNIGGIANYFYFPQKKSPIKPSAEDCGPGNVLLDILAQRLFKLKFDKNGVKARQGQPSERLLSILMANPFLKNHLKSTGREVFGDKLSQKIIDFGNKFKLSKYDLMATAVEFTIRPIAIKIRQLVKKDDKLKKLYLTGGGRKNIFLKKRLSHYLPELEILPIDVLGIDGDFVEAVSYAVLGQAALKSMSLSENDSRKNKTDMLPVLGRIVQPPG